MKNLKSILLTSLMALSLGSCGATNSVHTHVYTEEVTTPATCTEDGVKTFTCSCGDSYTEVISATGHVEEVTVATLDTAGTVTCSVCGEVLDMDIWTASTVVTGAFASLTGQTVTSRSATLDDGTEVRYLAGNFGTSYTCEQLATFAESAITSLDSIDTYSAVSGDDDGYGGIYTYTNDATSTVVAIETYSYATTVSDADANILQIIAYLG